MRKTKPTHAHQNQGCTSLGRFQYKKALNTGLVVATHGRHCVVELDDGSRIICHPRGKKSQSVVGDWVRWQAAADEGTIESVVARTTKSFLSEETKFVPNRLRPI